MLLAPAGEGTRATVRLFWHPPTGAPGKLPAVLGSADTERVLEDDLHRMKAFIERGLPVRSEPGGVSGGTVLH